MAKWTIKELAQMSGLSEARIRQIYRQLGRRIPTLDYVMSRKGKPGAKSRKEKTSEMLKYFGTPEGFREFMEYLKEKYGAQATIKEIIEKESEENASM